ncbi:hypothetical protein SAMN05660766_0792 [Curtobacterium sp. 314Chir4.1]|uniref:hypothetical protein n=1 Tax=Curtobacterium sp. 314Chir4.1 TaxID=1279028 RepID=UPI000BCA3B04|nr:hypothetical protein [Curtobacterium sp. 314Chir4.1]SOC87124.1 hypothetical protein SAMN05660766_0792 [Curtobacterium sp. 314Chir4.1]
MTRRTRCTAVIGTGFIVVVALTAVQVADVPGWVVLSTRVAIGVTAAATGLLVNRLIRNERKDR